MNTFGTHFRLTTFGESHGAALGGIIDGMPAGIPYDEALMCECLDRRRPGQCAQSSTRRETDRVEILSGLFDGLTTGQPIGFCIPNVDQRSNDYDALREVFRPSHADYTYAAKYGIRDHRGGGRSSARETVSRVVGGAFARMLLNRYGISITAWASQIGNVRLSHPYPQLDLAKVYTNDVRCPDMEIARRMQKLLSEIQMQGDTIGGCISCVIQGCPMGLGEPVFGKLQAQLAAAMMSIGAAKGFEYGEGFASASGRGSSLNDTMIPAEVAAVDGVGNNVPPVKFETNHSGGIQGGISNGEDIYFKVAFKPIATLMQPQQTVNIHGEATTIAPRGRHDVCAVPRAVPIVEAMACLVIADALCAK